MALKGAKARAAAMATPEKPARRTWRWWFGSVWLYLQVALLVEWTALWSRFTELPYECAHEPLPANNSGVKVLVAGYAKTGTRGMSRVLWQLGLEHSYHSEEFSAHVWAPLADNFWRRRVDGMWSFTPTPGLRAVLNQADGYVLNRTAPADLASAISACRTDAIAFDGLEMVFWPVYDISPDAKVLLMNWRTFEEWEKSFNTFMPRLFVQLYAAAVLREGMLVLPWGALFHLLDPLLMDRAIEKLMKSGGPPFNQVMDWWIGLYHHQFFFRRVVPRWISGLAFWPPNKHFYDRELQKVVDRVPKERLMEVNPTKHKYEDICRFLGISPCPRQGKLDKVHNLLTYERDFPEAFAVMIPVWLVLHFLSFNILRFLYNRLVYPCCRCCCCCCGRRHEKAA